MGASNLTRRQWLYLAGAACARSESADIRLRIAETTLELGPKRSLRTVAYNGQVPGPLLRVREGQQISVDVTNETSEPEIVHWHGLHIPPEVDGSHEEGTPHVPARGNRRYTFTPTPSGTRWYHSHVMAGGNLHRATYSGQFGMMIVEPRDNPGRYDLEVPILLHEWDARVVDAEVEYKLFSINGKMLGAGEPVRVRSSQRVLFRIVNASATMTHRLALTGHTLEVIALDGNAVPKPAVVRWVQLGPGERIDAMVDMKNPGVWVFGELDDRQREAGMGITVEYAGQTGPPRWIRQPVEPWDYTVFGAEDAILTPDETIRLEFKPKGERWVINGKLNVKTNRRYRLIFDNQSAMAHPVHLHRHTFALTRIDGKAAGGVRKDVVVVPGWRQAEVELLANNPGLSLFHCHNQRHMEMGFLTLMRYEN